MPPTPFWKEDHISQVPALQLLQNLGWTYLTPAEALRLRGDRLGNVILDGVLEDQLRRMNTVRFKGQEYPFTEGNIHSAVQALKDVVYDGLVRTNEKVYDLLCLGKSLRQSINGDTTGCIMHSMFPRFISLMRSISASGSTRRIGRRGGVRGGETAARRRNSQHRLVGVRASGRMYTQVAAQSAHPPVRRGRFRAKRGVRRAKRRKFRQVSPRFTPVSRGFRAGVVAFAPRADCLS